MPEGEIILSVEGAIGAQNDGTAARFDFDMLSALGTETIVTSTTWTDGVIEFTGVPVVAVLNAVDASGTTVTASALNDYASTMPIELLEESGAILAFTMDGERMSRRDKGPLWLIFPWDDKPVYARPEYKIHAVWQLNRLTVE